MLFDKSANSDKRLIKAYEFIDSGQIEALSVDIFDTVLWRKIPIPTDLFIVLGKKLKNEGWLIPAITPEIFSELRVMAETMARAHNKIAQKISEVNLTEIYLQMHGAFQKLTIEQMLEGNIKGIFDYDISQLVDIEVELENNLIEYDPNIIHLLFYAHQKKIPIVLVSDTYFTEDHISFFLDRPIPNRETSILPIIHQLYISSEYGYGKGNGLFKYVLSDLNLPPSKILHIGDNKKSDFLSALSEGMRALFYEKYDRRLQKILDKEWPELTYKRSAFLDPNQGDFGLTTLRSKIRHHKAIDEIETQDRFFWKYGASVLGPILLGFIHWIYDRCYQMGEKKVFCLMREGRLYKNLIKHFAPYYPKHQIEPYELWTSRAFSTQTSILHGNFHELYPSSLWALVENFTVEQYCQLLGVNVDDIGKWKKYKDVILESTSFAKKFIHFLVSNDSLRYQMIEASSKKRENLLKHLSEFVDIKHPGQMILVDIGWNGRAQGALQKVLKIAKSPLQLHGLYIGSTMASFQSLLQGLVREGYLIKGGHPSGHAYNNGCFVLEQTATAEIGLGSLKDIDENGHVITNVCHITSEQKHQAEIVQKGIFAFIDLVGPYIRDGSIKWDSNSEALQNQLRQILMRSMFNPTRIEARKFSEWYHEHAPQKDAIHSLGKLTYYNEYIPHMLPSKAFKLRSLVWIAAYAAQHSKALTSMAEAMSLKNLSPDCFLSIDHYYLKIFLDKGRGFPKKPAGKIKMKSNPNRKFYSIGQFFSLNNSIKQIQFAFEFPASLVRINSIRLTIFSKQSAEPEEWICFETQENSKDINVISGQPIDYNTFSCSDSLTLTKSFDQPDIYLVRMKVCCEMFEMSKKIS